MESRELLFISGSSKDRKGKRILVRDDDTENYIWPDEEIGEDVAKLMGITAKERAWIDVFFQKSETNSMKSVG